MGIKQKIARALTLGMLASTLSTGCATIPTNTNITGSIDSTIKSAINCIQQGGDDGYMEYTKRKEKAKKLLGVNNSEYLIPLRGGYLTTKGIDLDLRSFAALYAGTAKIRKVNNGYVIDGYYSEWTHPEALERVLRDADTNGDKIITRKELRDLERKVFKIYLNRK